eukprot:10499796-Alexandrium_andersonii.AAC.1
MRFELAKHEGEQMYGILLDQIKCFDRLVPSLQLEIQKAFGAPEQLVKVRSEYYREQVHIPKVGRYFGKCMVPTNGAVQGSVFSIDDICM